MTIKQVNAYRRKLRSGMTQDQKPYGTTGPRGSREMNLQGPMRSPIRSSSPSVVEGPLKPRRYSSTGQFSRQVLLAMKLMDEEEGAEQQLASNLAADLQALGVSATSTPTKTAPSQPLAAAAGRDHARFGGDSNALLAPPSYSNDQFLTADAVLIDVPQVWRDVLVANVQQALGWGSKDARVG